MIKSQFIIIGVLSLIAVVATTSTLSAYAQLKGSDVVSLASNAANGGAVDVKGVKDKALSVLDTQAVKNFADKISDQSSVDKILGQTGPQSPQGMLGGIGGAPSLPSLSSGLK